MASHQRGSRQQPAGAQTVEHRAGSMQEVGEQLASRWTARSQQIGQLLRLVGRPQQAGTDVFVHGAPKSGKSSIVREVLQVLGRQHAYVAVGETTKPKQLFSSVLSQLHAVKRRRDGGYAGAACDSVVEFAHDLARACPASKPCCYIVLDGSHLLARGPLLGALLHAREVTGAHVAFILVSAVPWCSQWFFEGLTPCVMPQVHFPAYKEQELVDILLQGKDQAVASVLHARPRSHLPTGHPSHPLYGATTPGMAHNMAQDSQDAAAGDAQSAAAAKAELYGALYAAFVRGVVVPTFMPVTRCVVDLAAVAEHLWPHYVQPLAKEVDASESLERVVRQLKAQVKQREAATLQALQPGMTAARLIHMAVMQLKGVSLSKGGGAQAAVAPRTQHAHDWGSLPVAAKLLVVAGYIASHNKASHDKAMFEAAGGPRKGRVRGAKAALDADRQAEVAKEARLKGPSPFTLHRLLYIYQVLYRSADHCRTMISSSSGSLVVGSVSSAAALQVQGLHALRPSFLLTSSILSSLQQGLTGSGCNSSPAGGDYGTASALLAPLPHGLQPSGGNWPAGGNAQHGTHAAAGGAAALQQVGTQQPHTLGARQQQQQGDVSMGCGDAADGDDGGFHFSQLLAEATRKPCTSKRGGQGVGARTKATTGARAAAAGAHEDLAADTLLPGFGRQAAPGTGMLALAGRSVGASDVWFESAAAQLPHPASGVARQGCLPLAPDAAPLLQNVTALTDMGLFKRGGAEDMLEAPRLALGCVGEALAAELARDCGLRLHNFLKYA